MTLWQPPDRTDAALGAIAAAEADRTERPERYALDVDHVAAAAASRQGDEALFAAGWSEGLEQYLGSAGEDGRLNALGIGMVAGRAISALRSGVRLSRHVAANPEVDQTPIVPPIFIIGGWRTGTTFLFRLLATDKRLRAPLPAELANPTRVAVMTEEQRRAHIGASAAAHEMLHALNPQLRAIHDSGAWLPEECVLAMGNDLRNWAFPSTVRLDGYARWLAGEDLHGVYRDHRRVMQILDAGDGRRWVLKAPAHTAALPALASAFPGALVVHLHRNIVETIASGASLFAMFRSTYSDEVDPVDVGRYLVDQTELWFRRAAEFRRAAAPGIGGQSVTFVDVDYGDLVADPAGVVASVYRAADMEPPADAGAFVAAYKRDNPRRAHGSHHYGAAQFGLDEWEIRERFSFLAA